jgi:hypothetical protein
MKISHRFLHHRLLIMIAYDLTRLRYIELILAFFSFPGCIALLVATRQYLLPKIFTPFELDLLDPPDSF